MVILIVLGVTIFGFRTYNARKYAPDNNAENSSTYESPTDLTAYDMNISGVDVEHIEGEYLNGFHLKPKTITHKGVIVTFGGSEGSPNYQAASIFAENGYEVFSLFFFGMENQQKELVKVPLEFFDEVLKYIDENAKDASVITLYGASKGAELSLNLAVRYPEIDNVILIAPSEYSYMGLSFSSREFQSSWTWEGLEVPFIDMSKGDSSEGAKMFFDMMTMNPVSYRGSYESAANGDPNRENARIKVENTNANILLIAGTDDMMWQSDVAAEHIYEKRPNNTEKLIYEGAGHIFYTDRYEKIGDMVLALGGDLDTNKKAAVDSEIKISEKLVEWHK